MLFLLLLFLWALAVLVGVALLPFRLARWASAYLIVVSTTAVACSVIIALAGVLGGSRLGEAFALGKWSELLALVGFGLGAIGGAAVGATLGFVVVVVFHLRARRRRKKAKAAVLLT